jgi:hypothetical protein
VADVFVQPSVRRKELVADVTIRNEDTKPYTVWLENTVWDADGLARTLRPVEVTVAPGTSEVVSVRENWPDPKLWWLESPHLYELRTELRMDKPESLANRKSQIANRKSLDCVATRFGFREVGREGPYFMLNGVPLALPGASAGVGHSRESAEAFLRRAKEANLRIVRMHTQPAEPHWLDLADEIGIFIMDEAAVYCYQGNYTWDERFWSNYRQHVQELARRDRNHPSLAIYSMENEVVYNLYQNPEYIQQWADAARYVRDVDLTRLILYEAGPDPGGAADLIGLHYPHEYMDGHYLYPDESYWPARPFQYAGMELRWKRDKPLYIGEWSLGLNWWRDHRSLFLGEKAYTDPEAWTTGDLAYASFEVPALRHLGISGNAWINLTPQAVETFRRLYAPVAVFLREYDWHFNSGEKVRRTLYLFNDTPHDGVFDCRWELLHGSRRLASGRNAERQAAGRDRTLVLTLPMPPVTTRTRLAFAARVFVDGKLATKEERRFDVFPTAPPPVATQVDPYPRPLPRSQGRGEMVGVLGDDPATIRALKRLGVRFETITPSQVEAFGGRTLVVAANGLTEAVASRAREIAAFVEKGGSVLCLPQKSYSKWLPITVEMDATHAATMTFVGAADHPALAGLEEEDLKFWHPGHLVSQRNLVKPVRGNFRAIVQAGGRDGLKWCPLLEVLHGRGRYLLCQMEVVARFDTEPTARQLLANLVRLATSPPRSAARPVGLLANPGPVSQFLDGLGLRVEMMSGRLGTLAGFGTLIVEAQGAAWEEASRHIEQLRDFAAKGGVVWVHGIAPEGLEPLRKMTGLDLNLEPVGQVAVTRCADDPVTQGLSNYDLYWHEPYVWDRFVPYRPIARHAFRLPPSPTPPSLPPGSGGDGGGKGQGWGARAKPLLSPAALVRVPPPPSPPSEGGVQGGFFLLDQVAWESEEPHLQQAMRYVCTLLTNLGVALHTSAFQSVDPRNFFTVDLRGFCNMGFRDEEIGDQQGGWTDQGPQDLRNVPVGQAVHGSAFYDVIDPATNGGKSCIVLRGSHRPYFPPEVRGIPVGQRARALWFLHSCAWALSDTRPVLKYVVHYADGATAEAPVRCGLHVADWFGPPQDLGAGEAAWVGQTYSLDFKDQRPCCLYAMRWTNPYPDRVIQSLDLVGQDTDAVPVVVAVSGER